MDKKVFVDQCLSKARVLYDEAEVFFTSSVASSITLYNGELDEFELSDSSGVQLLVCQGDKWAQAYSEEISPEAINFLLDKVASGLEVAEEAKAHELYAPKTAEELPELPQRDSFVFEADKVMASLNELNTTILNLAQAAGEEIRLANVSLQYQAAEEVLVNSLGLDRAAEAGATIVVAYIVVARGEEMKSGFDFQVINKLEELDSEKLARTALERAVETYGARSVAPGKYRVVLDPNTFGSLLAASLSGALSAELVQKGMSLLSAKLGEEIAAKDLSIYDFPASKDNPIPQAFDDEGVPTRKLALIEQGVLKNYLHNLETAKKAGVESTGSARRSYKSRSTPGLGFMYVEPGERDFEALLAEVGEGLLITELQGLHSGLNPISGDFSLPASGFLIKDGKKDRPVNQITIAGNILDLLKQISCVGSDSQLTMMFHFVPSVIIDDVAVSGDA